MIGDAHLGWSLCVSPASQATASIAHMPAPGLCFPLPSPGTGIRRPMISIPSMSVISFLRAGVRPHMLPSLCLPLPDQGLDGVGAIVGALCHV